MLSIPSFGLRAWSTGLALSLLLASALLPGVAAADEAPDPADARALVQDTTTRLLDVLSERQEAGEVDTDVVRARVDELVKPHLDFVTMTRLAVGRHWRSADDDQKRALVEEFRQMVVRTYTAALEQVDDYDAQQIDFLPLEPSDHADRVEVRSEVVQRNGPRIPVTYGLRYTGGEWKLYDVIVDGVSLVTTYRSGFGALVNREGIDGLIADLRARNERGEAEVPDIDAG